MSIIITKNCNYVKLLKQLHIEKIITLKKLKKLFKKYKLSLLNPNSKKFDKFLKLYLEDKICIVMLKELHIFDNNNTLKN